VLHQSKIPKFSIIQPSRADTFRDGIWSLMKDCIIPFRDSYNKPCSKEKLRMNEKMNGNILFGLF